MSAATPTRAPARAVTPPSDSAIAAVLGALAAARGAGAMGAKLSGGGQGGNIIALVDDESAPAVVDALTAAGAKNVLVTHLAPTIPRDLRP